MSAQECVYSCCSTETCSHWHDGYNIMRYLLSVGTVRLVPRSPQTRCLLLQVAWVRRRLLENSKIARATHNVAAWRVWDEARGVQLHDNDDDGENKRVACFTLVFFSFLTCNRGEIYVGLNCLWVK